MSDQERAKQLNCLNREDGLVCGGCATSRYTKRWELYCPVRQDDGSTQLVLLVPGQDYLKKDTYRRQPSLRPSFVPELVYDKPPGLLDRLRNRHKR